MPFTLVVMVARRPRAVRRELPEAFEYWRTSAATGLSRAVNTWVRVRLVWADGAVAAAAAAGTATRVASPMSREGSRVLMQDPTCGHAEGCAAGSVPGHRVAGRRRQRNRW